MARSKRRRFTSGSNVRPGTMTFEPILEEGVFRFDCSVNVRDAVPPSISFLNTNDRDISIYSEKVPLYTPTFACRSEKQVVKLELPVGSSLYGTGEASGELERTGKRVITWNTDAWGYGPGTTSLYQSHPWVLAVLPNGEAIGILADTTRRCEIDLRKESTIQFVAPSAYPVITFGPFASPTAVLISLSKAIGTVFMPPKWSLGYHQCHSRYLSDERVLEVAKTFRKKSIPCDVIWMDNSYMDGFRCFTFDKAVVQPAQERFRDPMSLVKDLHYSGFKAIWMLDPGIKQEEGYFVYDNGSKKDVWVQKEDGNPYVGEVWPVRCVFPDYTQSKVRAWWANLVKDFISKGADGIWNDMNEPSIFKDVTKTMPDSNVHSGDSELGGCQNHSFYHNVYGLLMARSTYEGMKLANEKKRPFVLSRAGFVGSQRYAATWTGDNLSTWEHLHMSISMVLQLGLSGQPLSGADIGGFAGNASPRLFGRWMGVGSLFPFCRGHSEACTTDHVPWSFGEECEEVCRLALKRRYRLIPLIYTLFYFAHTWGTPVATPTFFADPKDPSLRKLENSFLLGPILVFASTLRRQGLDKLEITLPKGIWLNFDFNDAHPDLPALYLKGGSIIPVGLPHEHVEEANPSDDLTLFVALDDHGKAEGVLFEDDGDGYEFTKGNYLLTHYVAELKSSVLTVSVQKTEGSWERPKRRLHIQLLLGGGAMLDTWGTDGEVLQLILPSEDEVSELVSTSEKNYKDRLENATPIPDVEVEVEVEEVSGPMETQILRIPIEQQSDIEDHVSQTPEEASTPTDGAINIADCSDAFKTTELFPSRDAVLNWAREVAKENGFVLTILRSETHTGSNKKNIRGKTYVILGCERSGKYRPYKNTLSKVTSSKKCECPFKLKGKALNKDEGWIVKVMCGYHNHDLGETLVVGHSYAGRLTAEEKSLVIDMTKKMVEPRNILLTLKDHNNDTTIRHIYNARQAYRSSQKGPRTEMQHLLKLLEHDQYVCWSRKVDDSDAIRDIFWAHPDAIKLLGSFHTVLFLDNTYKVNRYQLPLLEIVGVTSTELTFSVAFAYMESDEVDNFTWALQKLRELIVKDNEMPPVIITVRDIALMDAVQVVFPSSSNLLCRFHISKNVKAKCKLIVHPKEKYDLVMDAWDSVMNSPNEGEYMQRLTLLEKVCSDFPTFGDYVKNTWLIPHKEKFVMAWVDRVMHLGNTTIDRFETAHWRLENLLQDSGGDMCSCWDAVNNMIKLQHTQIKVSFEKSINIVEYNDPFYSKLRGFVSRNALSYIADHYDRVKTVGIDIDGSLCGCTIRTTHGLPCACELAKYSRTWHPIPLQAIHVHWRTLNFSDQEMNNEGLELALQREVDALHNQFQELDYAGKITLKAKLRELAFPDAILMCPSPENYFDAPKALGFRERQIN
ncbi:Alpha-glucosidase 2 [Glycine max]|nr:Alpha-glucosidase 2 [Glycine max]